MTTTLDRPYLTDDAPQGASVAQRLAAARARPPVLTLLLPMAGPEGEAQRESP